MYREFILISLRLPLSVGSLTNVHVSDAGKRMLAWSAFETAIGSLNLLCGGVMR